MKLPFLTAIDSPDQVSGDWNPDQPCGGRNRSKIRDIYAKVKQAKYKMVAIEGSLEDQPIFRGGPYK